MDGFSSSKPDLLVNFFLSNKFQNIWEYYALGALIKNAFAIKNFIKCCYIKLYKNEPYYKTFPHNYYR